MDSLESEPIALRLFVIEQLQDKHLSCTKARQLEDALHYHRVSVDPVTQTWTYHLESLGLTDSQQVHQEAARYAQMDRFQEACARLQAGQCADVLIKALQNNAWASLERPKGLYDDWKNQLDHNLAFAKKVLEQKETSTKGIFQCPSCKSYDVDTEQKQTRSADEPMTIFCHCTSCNRKFVR